MHFNGENMKIKEMLKSEKPRERLLEEGVENLSNEELIALILGSGTKDISSKELGQIILKEMGSVENLKNININRLSKIKGMGLAKSTSLIASLELGKRVFYIKKKNSAKIVNTNDVYELIKHEYEDLKYEKFGAIYLDTKNNVIEHKILFVGTLNSSTVHPREVFSHALNLLSSSIICIHNHPSGDPNPSIPDIEITNMLMNSGDMLGIKIRDHIIIGKNNFYSFYENANK